LIVKLDFVYFQGVFSKLRACQVVNIGGCASMNRRYPSGSSLKTPTADVGSFIFFGLLQVRPGHSGRGPCFIAVIAPRRPGVRRRAGGTSNQAFRRLKTVWFRPTIAVDIGAESAIVFIELTGENRRQPWIGMKGKLIKTKNRVRNKPTPSLHEVQMRRWAVAIVIMSLLLFTALFYVVNRWAVVP
jgi:hypothetical protein